MPTNTTTAAERTEARRLVARVFVTVLLLGIAIWLITYNEQKTAMFIIGAVTGYWLK